MVFLGLTKKTFIKIKNLPNTNPKFLFTLQKWFHRCENTRSTPSCKKVKGLSKSDRTSFKKVKASNHKPWVLFTLHKWFHRMTLGEHSLFASCSSSSSSSSSFFGMVQASHLQHQHLHVRFVVLLSFFYAHDQLPITTARLNLKIAHADYFFVGWIVGILTFAVVAFLLMPALWRKRTTS